MNNQPRSINPALVGQPPGQPSAAQSQQTPQQSPGSAGLLGPNGQPIQPQYIELRINPEGVAIPTTTMNGDELVQHLGGQVPYSMVITWVEIVQAFAFRDAVIQWLERRVDDLEKGLQKPGITYEQFMFEHYAAAQAAAQAAMQSPAPEGDPPR